MKKLATLAVALTALACGQAPQDMVANLPMMPGKEMFRSNKAQVRVNIAAGEVQGAASSQQGGNGGAERPLHGLDGIKSIVVSINQVTVHAAGGGWQTLMTGTAVVDLIRLAESAEVLGLNQLPAGRITQIRLYMSADPAAYVETTDGERHALKVPSALRSGIKIKGPWDFRGCDAADIDLTMDPRKSIHIHGIGRDDSYILRPVIRLAGTRIGSQDGCVPGGEDGDTPNGGSSGGASSGGTSSGGASSGGPGGGGGGGGDDGEGGDQPGDNLCYTSEGIVPCDGGTSPTDGTGGTTDGTGTGGTGSTDGTGGTTDGTGTGGSGSTDGTGGTTDGTGTGGTGSTDGTGGTTDGTGTGGSGSTDGTGGTTDGTGTGTGSTDGTGGTTDGTGTGTGSTEPMECMTSEGPVPC